VLKNADISFIMKLLTDRSEGLPFLSCIPVPDACRFSLISMIVLVTNVHILLLNNVL